MSRQPLTPTLSRKGRGVARSTGKQAGEGPLLPGEDAAPHHLVPRYSRHQKVQKRQKTRRMGKGGCPSRLSPFHARRPPSVIPASC